ITYDLLVRYFPKKTELLGFRILHRDRLARSGGTSAHPEPPTLAPQSRFFCCGGFNALSRKNLDKVLTAFQELDHEGKLAGAMISVYIQGVEIPSQLKGYAGTQASKYLKMIHVGSKSYREILQLYEQHDIFV